MESIQHKFFDEQIEILKSRNMLFDDVERAEETLSKISYYKIKEFARPFIVLKEGAIDYQKTPFEVVLSRYYQDKNLRHLIFHVIEDIEVAVKTYLSYVLGEKYGAYGYLDFKLWCNKKEYCKHFILHKQEEFTHELKKSLSRRMIVEVLEKLKTGENKKYPPVWLAVNYLSFGQMVNFLELMSSNNLKDISNCFGCSKEQFMSWLKCLNLIRNICAHNSNVIDLKLTTVPLIKQEWKDYLLEVKEGVYSNRIALPILIIVHFMNSINPKNKKIYEIFSSLKNLCKTSHWAKYYGFSSKKIHKIIQKD